MYFAEYGTTSHSPISSCGAHQPLSISGRSANAQPARQSTQAAERCSGADLIDISDAAEAPRTTETRAGSQ